jgi:hypothetical protein
MVLEVLSGELDGVSYLTFSKTMNEGKVIKAMCNILTSRKTQIAFISVDGMLLGSFTTNSIDFNAGVDVDATTIEDVFKFIKEAQLYLMMEEL